MDDAGLLPYPSESPATGLLDAARPLSQPTQGRGKWTREENTELMMCYYTARLEGKGYRNRLKCLWDARNPSKSFRSENNLCCQARAVIHSKLLTEFELQAIEQSVSCQTSTSSDFQPTNFSHIFLLLKLYTFNKHFTSFRSSKW